MDQNPPVTAQTTDTAGTTDTERSLRKSVLAVYVLYAASIVIPFAAVAGMIVAHIKRGDARAHHWLASHFRWQIRTFWYSLLWGLVAMLLAFIGVGVILGIVVSVWFIYRVVKGWLRLSDGTAPYRDKGVPA